MARAIKSLQRLLRLMARAIKSLQRPLRLMARAIKNLQRPLRLMARAIKISNAHPRLMARAIKNLQRVEEARRASARSVNAVMTSAYWQVPRRIVEHEQGGARMERSVFGASIESDMWGADQPASHGRCNVIRQIDRSNTPQ